MIIDEWKRAEERDNLLSNFINCLLRNQKEIKGSTVILGFWHSMIEEYVEYRIAERAAGRK